MTSALSFDSDQSNLVKYKLNEVALEAQKQLDRFNKEDVSAFSMEEVALTVKYQPYLQLTYKYQTVTAQEFYLELFNPDATSLHDMAIHYMIRSIYNDPIEDIKKVFSNVSVKASSKDAPAQISHEDLFIREFFTDNEDADKILFITALFVVGFAYRKSASRTIQKEGNYSRLRSNIQGILGISGDPLKRELHGIDTIPISGNVSPAVKLVLACCIEYAKSKQEWLTSAIFSMLVRPLCQGQMTLYRNYHSMRQTCPDLFTDNPTLMNHPAIQDAIFAIVKMGEYKKALGAVGYDINAFYSMRVLVPNMFLFLANKSVKSGAAMFQVVALESSGDRARLKDFYENGTSASLLSEFDRTHIETLTQHTVNNSSRSKWAEVYIPGEDKAPTPSKWD